MTRLLDIALDCGFQNHETFTRAFRRRWPAAQQLPSLVRTQAEQRPETAAEQPDEAYSISETKIRRLHRAHLAFIRHVGPYEAVPDTMFDTSKTGPPTKVLPDRASGSASAMMPQVRPPGAPAIRRGAIRSVSLHPRALSGTRCSKARLP
jgi:hypothetical protein